MSCLFCRIVAGDIPASKVYEDEQLLAFNDINPQAPMHVLVIPKAHVATTNELAPEHDGLVGSMVRRAAAIARERGYDGSGFPRNLAGEKIPLGARILAVADAYDELVSGIGGPSVSVDRALEILSVERIAEFDPVVIGALVLLQPQSNPVTS